MSASTLSASTFSASVSSALDNGRPVSAPSASLPLTTSVEWESKWAEIVSLKHQGGSLAASTGGEAARLYLTTSSMAALDALYDAAIASYVDTKTPRHDSAGNKLPVNSTLLKAISESWGTLSDSIRSAFTRSGMSISFARLTSIYAGTETRKIDISTKAEAAALKRDQEKQAAENRAAALQTAALNKQAAEAAALSALTAADIAADLRGKLALCGASLTDVIVHLMDENGAAVRQFGAGLSAWVSLAEAAEAAEATKAAEAAKREAAKQARAAKREAAKQARAEAAKAEAAALRMAA